MKLINVGHNARRRSAPEKPNAKLAAPRADKLQNAARELEMVVVLIQSHHQLAKWHAADVFVFFIHFVLNAFPLLAMNDVD